MARLSELMFQEASRSVTESTPDLQKALAQGAELAIKKQQNALAQEKLFHQQNLLASKKDDKSIEEIKILTNPKVNPKMKSLLAKQFERKAIERGTPYAPEFIKAVAELEFDQSKISGVLNNYQSHYNKALQTGIYTPELADARAELANVAYGGDLTPLIGLETKLQGAQITAEAHAARQKTQIAASKAAADVAFARVAPKALATKRSADHNKFFGESGGFTAAVEKVKKLQNVVRMFKEKEIKTGGTKGVLKGLTETGLALADPKLKGAMDDARASINLKASLDSQFAQREAEQQYKMRTIDPALDTKTNQARVEALLREAQQSVINSIEGFKEQGLPVPEEEYRKFRDLIEPKSEKSKPKSSAIRSEIRSGAVDLIKQAFNRNVSVDVIKASVRQQYPNISDRELNELIKQARGK